MTEDQPKRLKMDEIVKNSTESSTDTPANVTIFAQNSSHRRKQPQPIPEPSTETPHCHYWVKRKSRYCKMTIKEGAKFCGEHALDEPQPALNEKRILCPLDPTHSVYSFKLEKHLKICNVKKLENTASYVKKGINTGGSEGNAEDDENFRLRDVPQEEIDKVTKIVEKLFDEFVEGNIKSCVKSHKVLDEEIKKEIYGDDKLRHLIQTSSILGILEDNKLFTTNTCFIDLGAGKGNLSYWLSKAILDDKIENSKVLVIDRASHRHKRDNLIRETGVVDRLRVDIGDLDMKELDFCPSTSIVGVSKHLCGRATDFALRCIINGNSGNIKTKGFLICVCCHHQITFDSFLGRDWIVKQGVDRKVFNLITKMVSWTTCGDGKSREHHKEVGVNCDEKIKERELVGWKCKRLLDFARAEYMRDQGYDAKLCFYVEKEQTLENVCIFGVLEESIVNK